MGFDFSQFPILTTDRLHLRRIVPTDMVSWFEIFQDSQAIRYLSDIDEPFSTPEMVAPFIQWANEIYEEKSGIRWAITYKNNPTLIGTCGFHKLNLPHRKAEIGYELGSQYWRQGIMREAVKAILNFCFGELNLHRIEADVTEGNEASASLLRQLGFIHEGTWRDAVYSKGQFRNLWQFSLLEGEYSHSPTDT